MADEDFEVLTPSEVDAQLEPERETSTKVRKLCACGCGEEVPGNRALKRGHTMGTGLQVSSFAPEDVLMVQAAFSGLFMGGTALIGKRRKIPGMEVEEAQALANPAGRIFVRHFPKKALRFLKPGDVADGLAISSAIGMYLARISQSTQETPTVANYGFQPDQTVSGLHQYAYIPPEQTFQQENGVAGRSYQFQDGG